ncbi:hypothetical protein D3C80_951310 [compost metagenome]
MIGEDIVLLAIVFFAGCFDQEGVGKIHAQTIVEHHLPGFFQVEGGRLWQLRVFLDVLPGKRRSIERITLEAGFSDDRVGEFVVRAWSHKIGCFKAGGGEQSFQLYLTEGLGLAVLVAAFDAVHGNAHVIFRGARKILETKLVFDGNEQMTVWL